MEFEYSYTEEQERFRKEVRAWLEENVPEEMKTPIDPSDRSEERYHYWREKNKELAKKGWHYPAFPKEYGGGGLSGEYVTILSEEFTRARAPFHGSSFILGALLVWATEEQKQEFLVPLLTAEKVSWQKFSEPHSGSDLASYVSKAVKDGDDWIMNGSNAFPGGHEDDVGWYFGPMVTDPDAPRHRNLGFFMIPYPNPGLDFKRMRGVAGGEQCFIYLNDVRVPGANLIGGETQGWQVCQTTLEEEHGGQGSIFHRDEEVKSMASYMQEQRKNGESPGGDPVVQQKAVEAIIESHITNLFAKRTAWMYQNRMEMSWEGPSSFVFDRVSGLRQVGRFRDVLGMHTMLGAKDPRTPHGGLQEVFQRSSLVLAHGAGSLNISKVVLARRIGISRTKERAAPTTATATSYSG